MRNVLGAALSVCFVVLGAVLQLRQTCSETIIKLKMCDPHRLENKITLFSYKTNKEWLTKIR